MSAAEDSFWEQHHTLAELERLRTVEAVAAALMVKVGQHKRRGWERIAVGAFDSLAAALSVEPSGLHDEDRCALWLTEDPSAVCTCVPVWPLLVAEPGTVAARLDTLPLPCETDGAA